MFSVAANALLFVARLVFYVAAPVFTCVRMAFSVAEAVLVVAATPTGTHEGGEVSRCSVLADMLVVSARDLNSCLSR